MEPALADAVAQARRAWPNLALPEDGFLRHLESKLGAAPLTALRVDELYLAFGCGCGAPAAVAAFERRYMPTAARAVMGIDASQDARADALQKVRARLLVGEAGHPPVIMQYAGIGSLEGWLRIAAVRTALNALRGTRREVPAHDSLLAAVGTPITEPELAMVKVQYRGALEQATVRAFEQLPDDQRELLRLYVVDGLTLEELGRIHDVHTSTVSRWLTRIRDKIASDARRYFASECQLPESECDSLVRVVQSEMHVSVARLLGAAS